jgi:hypothetical protein
VKAVEITPDDTPGWPASRLQKAPTGPGVPRSPHAAATAMDLFADRYLCAPVDWQPTWQPPRGPRASAGRAARCAFQVGDPLQRPLSLWHPFLVEFIDFGAVGPVDRFEILVSPVQSGCDRAGRLGRVGSCLGRAVSAPPGLLGRPSFLAESRRRRRAAHAPA